MNPAAQHFLMANGDGISREFHGGDAITDWMSPSTLPVTGPYNGLQPLYAADDDTALGGSVLQSLPNIDLRDESYLPAVNGPFWDWVVEYNNHCSSPLIPSPNSSSSSTLTFCNGSSGTEIGPDVYSLCSQPPSSNHDYMLFRNLDVDDTHTAALGIPINPMFGQLDYSNKRTAPHLQVPAGPQQDTETWPWMMEGKDATAAALLPVSMASTTMQLGAHQDIITRPAVVDELGCMTNATETLALYDKWTRAAPTSALPAAAEPSAGETIQRRPSPLLLPPRSPLPFQEVLSQAPTSRAEDLIVDLDDPEAAAWTMKATDGIGEDAAALQALSMPQMEMSLKQVYWNNSNPERDTITEAETAMSKNKRTRVVAGTPAPTITPSAAKSARPAHSNATPLRSQSPAPTQKPGLTFEQVSQYFYVPITQAAKELNVGLTLLKKRCRELGIPRWPHRKMRSIQTLITNVYKLQDANNDAANCNVDADENLRRAVEMLEEEKKTMERCPSVRMEEKTRKLRQSCFKANYKRKRMQQMVKRDPPASPLIP